MAVSSRSFVDDILKEALIKKERLIMDQLRWFIDREILVLKQGPAALVATPDNKYELRQTVELQLKDKKYIEKLENENKQKEATIEKQAALIERLKKRAEKTASKRHS